MNRTVNLTIDGQAVEARVGQTILEVATEMGIYIPTLCHHPALKPIGACRVCLVETSKTQPLYPACAYEVTQGLTVDTCSPRVEKARRFVLELLFSERNHYCMYCEMSGNCELQDLGYRYGLDHWVYPTYTQRFPVDATRETFLMDHNRCVLCRRCVRACDELVANHTLGLRQRGAQTMICADMNVPFGESTCISCGTCLQVCPTGALIDKRSAYMDMGHHVQVERVQSTCSQCSLGCGIEIVTRGGNVMRVEGAWEAQPNGGVLCKKGRFDPLYDTRERVTTPMVRHNGSLEAASWDEALATAAQHLGKAGAGKLGVLTSTHTTNEALYLLSTLFGKELGVTNMDLLNDGLSMRLEPRGSLADLAQHDLILVVGVDPVADQPVASFLAKRVVDTGARLIVVDDGDNGLAPFATLHVPLSDLRRAVEVAARADHPVVVYGAGLSAEVTTALEALDGALFIALEPGVNTRAAMALGLSQGFDPAGVSALYILLGEQTPDGNEALKGVSPDAFTVVQASYASPLLERADVVLPMAIWSERSGSLTNTEGRMLKANQAVIPEGEARADWQILYQLAGKMGKPVAGSLEELSTLAAEQLKLEEVESWAK
jgi:formate dehydrogenase major subunit